MKNKVFFIGLLILGIGLLGAVSVTACGGPKIVTQDYNIDTGEKRVISIVLMTDDKLEISVTVAESDDTLPPPN